MKPTGTIGGKKKPYFGTPKKQRYWYIPRKPQTKKYPSNNNGWNTTRYPSSGSKSKYSNKPKFSNKPKYGNKSKKSTSGSNSKATEGPIGLAVSWQNKYGRWFSWGPIQKTWTGEKSETKSLGYVFSERKGALRYLGRHGKYKVYSVGYRLKSYDIDVRKKLGITRW